MRGCGWAGCGFSANEYSCANGAQINVGDRNSIFNLWLRPYSQQYNLDLYLIKLFLYSRCGGSLEMRSGRNRRHFSPQETKPNLSLSLFVDFYNEFQAFFKAYFLDFLPLTHWLSLEIHLIGTERRAQVRPTCANICTIVAIIFSSKRIILRQKVP
jgi:hypothetical protein